MQRPDRALVHRKDASKTHLVVDSERRHLHGHRDEEDNRVEDVGSERAVKVRVPARGLAPAPIRHMLTCTS